MDLFEEPRDFEDNNQVTKTEAQLRSLSIQVLSMVEDRVRRAFGGSSPISIPSPPLLDPVMTRLQRNESTLLLSTTPTLTLESDQLPIFTLEDVSYHETRDDCWIIIYDRVYNVTHFLAEHPGGEEVLLEYAGRDCTLPFRSSGHSKYAEDALEPYLIGILPERERLWSNCFDPRHDRI